MQIKLVTAEIRKLIQASTECHDMELEDYLFGLQRRLDPRSGLLDVNDEDLQKLQRFAFDYGVKKWKDSLKEIFARTLGRELDGRYIQS
jgi:hypothetical protein